MTSPMAFAGSRALAVGLAVLAAVLFGLAAVRQHGVVRSTEVSVRRSVHDQVTDFVRLLRTPSWVVGAVQGLTAGGLHIVALALAPIALVQPIGVLAVPVTVVASAVRRRRPPPRAQVVGALVSVVSIAVLTLLLLAATSPAASVPSVLRVVATVGLVVLVMLGLVWLARVVRPFLRCVCLALVAAVLFGLTSAIVRLISRILSDGPAAHPAVLVTVEVALLITIPGGIWALQTAYAAGAAQVVICCTTLVDPLAAVVGGAWLLRERFALDPVALVGVACCAGLTAVGVVLLSRGPTNPTPATTRSTPERGAATTPHHGPDPRAEKGV